MSFINLEGTKGLFTYDLIRSAMYQVGLPVTEDEVDEVYGVYVNTGSLPAYLNDYFESHSVYYDE